MTLEQRVRDEDDGVEKDEIQRVEEQRSVLLAVGAAKLTRDRREWDL